MSECVCCDRDVPENRFRLCGWCRRNLRTFVDDDNIQLIVFCNAHAKRIHTVGASGNG